jgi:hypothetical protein
MKLAQMNTYSGFKTNDKEETIETLFGPVLSLLPVAESKKNGHIENVDENIFNIITNKIDCKKFVVTLPAGYSNRTDLLIIACCNEEIMNNPYEINIFPGVYKPDVEIINTRSVVEILNGNIKSTNLYKSYEYLASYLYHNSNNIDCYSVGLLNDLLNTEDKALSYVNINYLATKITDAKKFELIHNVINKKNIFANDCSTPSGSNILMMIFENHDNDDCINSYVKMLKSAGCEVKDTKNIINKKDNYGRNIFSFGNHENLTKESYESILELGYDINTKYTKEYEEINIIFDLLNCIDNYLSQSSSKDSKKSTPLLNPSPFDYEHNSPKEKPTIDEEFSERLRDRIFDPKAIFKPKCTDMSYLKRTDINAFKKMLNQIESLEYLIFHQSLREESLENKGSNVVFKIIDLICKIISLLPEINQNNDQKLCISKLNTILTNLLQNSIFNINYTNKSNENILTTLIRESYNGYDNVNKYCKYIIKKLLANNDKVDVNHRDDSNKIPLEYIVGACDSEMFALFCNYPLIDLSLLTSKGHSIAFVLVDKLQNTCSIKSPYIEMFIDLLNSKKFNCNDVTYDKKNLIAYLCSRKSPVCLRLMNKIISTGIDINKQDNNEMTALDYLTQNQQWLLRDALIKNNDCVNLI